MNTTPKRAPRVLRISERVYGALLAAYPAQNLSRNTVGIWCRCSAMCAVTPTRTRGEIGLFLS